MTMSAAEPVSVPPGSPLARSSALGVLTPFRSAVVMATGAGSEASSAWSGAAPPTRAAKIAAAHQPCRRRRSVEPIILVPPLLPDRILHMGLVERDEAGQRRPQAEEGQHEPDRERVARHEPAHRDHPTAQEHQDRKDLHRRTSVSSSWRPGPGPP